MALGAAELQFTANQLWKQGKKCCSDLSVPVVVGATAFVLSLLEPDPDKRPSVRAAMEEKWINEGYAKKPLHAQAHKNR